MNNKSANTYIRTLYSPGFSCLTMSFWKLNLTLSFNPYIGIDNRGFSKYDLKTFLSTSVNYEGAAGLCFVASSIFMGKDAQKEIGFTLPCSNNATLKFEYKPDENNQMNAWLIINKNSQTMAFRFPIHEYKAKENGQIITKVVQTGLGSFVKLLDGYLLEIGGASHLSKLPDEVLDPEMIYAPKN